ncbi:hypothetical protein HT136_24245 [Novosphingobium profundi]|uniref:hypothetical protein n=1 Tax=Novosphingobium profundi TaxID=1774954 RepID=UPI001BD985D0|nr:hypothetical protein [Novosphingobium profundi]MBT0671486.1 hypothetical protein [Novosphingobium profundi]
MIDVIANLWRASPVNPITAAVVSYLIFKLYAGVGLRWLTAIAICVGLLAAFWSAERTLSLLQAGAAIYIAARLFGLFGGGGSVAMPLPEKAPDEGPRIPFGAPMDYNPNNQLPGTHWLQYNPEEDINRLDR